MLAEGGVDFVAAQRVRKRARRYHRLRSGDLRVVAFVGYADEIVSQTEGIDDFGCTRKQRQNSHGSLTFLRKMCSRVEQNSFVFPHHFQPSRPIRNLIPVRNVRGRAGKPNAAVSRSLRRLSTLAKNVTAGFTV